jgi:hypothetical protein
MVSFELVLSSSLEKIMIVLKNKSIATNVKTKQTVPTTHQNYSLYKLILLDQQWNSKINLGIKKNLQEGFTVHACLSGTVADDCVRLISRNHSQRQKEVTKKPP